MRVDVIVFCEVKTRSVTFSAAIEAVILETALHS